MLLFEWTILISASLHQAMAADDDFNVLNRDGSYEFGYNNPDSFHYSQANRNNVVRGRFGGRNPETGALDTTVYTAGPRGYRPRGKNIVRNFDPNQSGPRPIGSKDDPYFDPSEDPSYNFGFRTPTYSRQESANRLGNVNGRYTYLDDENVRHDVEYIAGRNTGFHVITPYPDSNPRAYGNGYFRGRGNPPRGRTSIQRGLDGSYKFVSVGPDQRRTETSDAVGNVRGSYTYLDEKGVQHSVHYIAGPGIGYRVLKNVKGPHLPTIYPFGRPEIIPSDFYDSVDKDLDTDLFDAAASAHVKPIDTNNLGRPKPKPSGLEGFVSQSTDGSKRPGGSGTGSDNLFGSGGGSSPAASKPSFDYDEDVGLDELFQSSGAPNRLSTTTRPNDLLAPGGSFEDDGSYRPGKYDGADDLGETSGATETKPIASDSDKEAVDISTFQSGTKPGFGPGGGASKPFGSGTPSSSRPFESGTSSSSKPFGTALQSPSGSGPFISGTQSASRPSKSGAPELFGSGTKPLASSANKALSGLDESGYDDFDFDFKPSSSGRPVLQLGIGGTGGGDSGGSFTSGSSLATIVKNVGDTLFTVPPGVSVRAHVQSIDLLPLSVRTPSPSEQYRIDTRRGSEQLDAETSNINERVDGNPISSGGNTTTSSTTIATATPTTTAATTTSAPETTTTAPEENSTEV